MKRTIILNAFTAFFLICSMAVHAKANEATPACRLNRELLSNIGITMDTIPAPVKSGEVATSKPVKEQPVAAVIKAVPKARKVTIPKPVTVKVKPVKIIKPKIIKPVLKVL